ncbi:hypothetical protein GALMADRAFT_700408 [Galerina marginata CBS 339.88]|uniref:MYND-type domain-containing protein n=1 Tax=Galerina marginata (strain CBS 339.88) TaxID=685588 RepID=A0A067TYK3_GALM3|nr:hypothetical protein GALMADRAFT_700408 [Galerina marginata CBS 339.88]
MAHLCASCHEPTGRRCAGCWKVWYCGNRCQENDWFIHLFDCKSKDQITTADHLYRATVEDKIPSDEQTKHDYGFTRAYTSQNHLRLLGIYIGLMNSSLLSVKARTLHKWRIGGTLVQNIISQYQSLPPTNQVGCFPWFLENHWWIFDGKLEPRVEDAETLKIEAETLLTKGWLYSGGVPTDTTTQIKKVTAKWPKEKKTCMLFCGLILLGTTRPNPSIDSWKQFGFCTCDSKYEEVELAHLYQRLLHFCTFQEFFSAYETSGLAGLFMSKGLESEFSRFPYLKRLLENSPHMFDSVWELKRLVVQSDNWPNQINPAVFADYGFGNCKTEEEINDLKAIYKEYFLGPKKCPPALHLACIQGNLFNYVSTFVVLKNKKEKKKYRRLMKNPYSPSSTNEMAMAIPL